MLNSNSFDSLLILFNAAATLNYLKKLDTSSSFPVKLYSMTLYLTIHSFLTPLFKVSIFCNYKIST